MLSLLSGIKVLDVTTIVLGPMATQILADLGADVIKIEPPTGDLSRNAPPVGADGIGALFHNNNRNKRSLALDLKSQPGREVMARLIRDADLLVHNMRARAMEGLGCGPEAARAINPRLIYCAAVGFGSDGPYRGRPAYDDVIQAASGLAGLSMMAGREPAYAPSIIADKVIALHVVYAVLAALLERERTGLGREIEVPMYECMVSFVLNEHLAAATFDEDGKCGYHRVLARDRRPFRTADGWIAILAYTHGQWSRLLTEIGRDDIVACAWFNDAGERSRRSGELYSLLAEATPRHETQDWMTILARLDVPHAPVNTFDDLLTDAHLSEIGFFAPGSPGDIPLRALPQAVSFAGAPAREDAPAPRLGAHSAEILRESGYSHEAIEQLIAEGIILAGGN